MISKRLNTIGLLTAAAIASGVLVGCGGSSNNNSINHVPGSITAVGGFQSISGNATSVNGQQVQVSTSGGTYNGTSAGGVNVGDACAVIPAGTPIISGLGLAAAKNGGVVSRVSSPYQVNVIINGVKTAVATVTAQGELSNNIVLDANTPNVTIQALGPFSITQGPNTLTVQEFDFGIMVNSKGVASVPTNVALKLPPNGGQTSNGNYVVVTYPIPAYATGSGSLTITGLSSGSKDQTRALNNGVASFYDPMADIEDGVPATGVNAVIFNYAP